MKSIQLYDRYNKISGMDDTVLHTDTYDNTMYISLYRKDRSCVDRDESDMQYNKYDDGDSSHDNSISIDLDCKNNDAYIQYYTFYKRLSYVYNNIYMYVLDIDVRCIDGVKIFGVKHLLSYQYDVRTNIICGVSLLPASHLLILGCSRYVYPDM